MLIEQDIAMSIHKLKNRQERVSLPPISPPRGSVKIIDDEDEYLETMENKVKPRSRNANSDFNYK